MTSGGESRYKILVQPEAQEEIAEAYHWYENRSQGLGTEFVRAVEARFAAIQRNPTTYPEVHKQVRRALLRRFPYSIFYIIDEQSIIVRACFHASRDPKRWQNRIEDSSKNC